MNQIGYGKISMASHGGFAGQEAAAPKIGLVAGNALGSPGEPLIVASQVLVFKPK
ncbi:MAG: hypothetical protein L0Z07_10500 [Planctomycetes bacterium]|nr:hypothetical protein [Planctomycetota bacterium]